MNACSKTVYHAGHTFRGSPCKKKATFFEGGKHWCGLHAPSMIRARRDRWNEKFDRELAEREERAKAQEKRNKWRDHCEQMFPKLVEALQLISAKWSPPLQATLDRHEHSGTEAFSDPEYMEASALKFPCELARLALAKAQEVKP